MTETKTGLSIKNLEVTLGTLKDPKQIIHGIDLELIPGQITGLAGESGSGKSMTGLAICGILPENARTGGSIEFGGRNLLTLGERQMNQLRGKEIAMVFQDPTASLHPMINIEGQLTDHLRVHKRLSRKAASARALEVLKLVQVPHPEAALRKYPHQFSGGQLQRIAIAVAVICEPSILIADEPTTALDVTVQAGILRLLRTLCDDLDLAIMLVTHDLGVMSSLADRISIMRQGLIVEEGDRYSILTNPQHDYTKALIDALPRERSEDDDYVDPASIDTSLLEADSADHVVRENQPSVNDELLGAKAFEDPAERKEESQ